MSLSQYYIVTMTLHVSKYEWKSCKNVYLHQKHLLWEKIFRPQWYHLKDYKEPTRYIEHIGKILRVGKLIKSKIVLKEYL